MEDADLVALLNRSRESEKENIEGDATPPVNDLLCFTDAAVKALDNAKLSKKSKFIGCPPHMQSTSARFHPLSPKLLTGIFGGDPEEADGGVAITEMSPKGIDDKNNSVGSQSSTASEILIRSTTQPSKGRQSEGKTLVMNTSASSHNVSSSSSRASSSFLTGNAQKVKVSVKKLKEIVSPFQSFQSQTSNDIALASAEKPKRARPGVEEVASVEPPIVSLNRNNSNGASKLKKTSAKSSSSKSKNPKQVFPSSSSCGPKRKEAKDSPSRLVDGQTESGMAKGSAKEMSSFSSTGNSNYQVHVQRHVTDEEISKMLKKQQQYDTMNSTSDGSVPGVNTNQIYRDLQNDIVITDVVSSGHDAVLKELYSDCSSLKSGTQDFMSTTSSKGIDVGSSSGLLSGRDFGFTETGCQFIENILAGSMPNETISPFDRKSVCQCRWYECTHTLSKILKDMKTSSNNVFIHKDIS